jgi:hypothetical protein
VYFVRCLWIYRDRKLSVSLCRVFVRRFTCSSGAKPVNVADLQALVASVEAKAAPLTVPAAGRRGCWPAAAAPAAYAQQPGGSGQTASASLRRGLPQAPEHRPLTARYREHRQLTAAAAALNKAAETVLTVGAGGLPQGWRWPADS